jgi:hypothetical protein
LRIGTGWIHERSFQESRNAFALSLLLEEKARMRSGFRNTVHFKSNFL